MTANEGQIGGAHYKSEYQHWDLVLDTGMGYLEGCATKYVARWRKKGGIEDLQKALHYGVKLVETGKEKTIVSPGAKEFILTKVSEFCVINECDVDQLKIIRAFTLGENKIANDLLAVYIEKVRPCA